MQFTKCQKILLFAIAILSSSCFHKSTKTGTADDISGSFVCHTAKGDYLITHETIFQATSKSSGPKGNYTSGYTDYRFTVRDLQTGAQTARLVLDEDDIYTVGFDGKLLWCYSPDKKTGFHARNPVTFEIAVTQAQVEAANPSLAGNINMPKITDADQNFIYDPVSRSIMITDTRGNLFLLDPVTLKAAVIKKKPGYSDHFSDAKNTSAYCLNGKNISLEGSPRNSVTRRNDVHDNIADETYLSGSILLERNSDQLASIASALLSKDQTGFEQMKREHDSLLAKYPALTNEQQASLTIKDYSIVDRYIKLGEKIRDHASDSGYAAEDIIGHLSNMVLGDDSNSVYIMHANNLSDTASLLISRVKITGGHSFSLWTTLVPNIYFDPGKGIKRNPMGDVFKKGNPEFDYERYAVEGHVLVGIKMLFAFGIDTETGKLLWKVQL